MLNSYYKESEVEHTRATAIQFANSASLNWDQRQPITCRQWQTMTDLYKFAITSFVCGKLSLLEGDDVDSGIINISDVTSFVMCD